MNKERVMNKESIMNKKLMVVAVMFFTVLNVYAQEARFTQVSGTVEVRTAGSQNWQPAVAGGIIGKGTVISTGLKSTAVISLGSSTITVSPITRLTLEELVRRDGTEDAIFYLSTGKIRADIKPPTGLKQNFKVHSPMAVASVRGTSFTFDGRRLIVHSGQVQFANHSGQKVYVNSNQQSYADTGLQHRLALPFEAEAEALRPALPDLTNTGSVREQPLTTSTDSALYFEWP